MVMSKLSPLIQLLTIWLSLIAVFLWVQTPALTGFSLQAFALAMLLYFGLKRLARSKWSHLAPTPGSLEMPIITFALMLLVGSTGNTESVLFPLAYLHLFFLILSTETLTAVGSVAGLMLFHWALMSNPSLAGWTDIASLPILGLIFFFSKHQHGELVLAKKAEAQAEAEKSMLERQATDQHQMINQLAQAEAMETALITDLESFLSEFMQPKIEYLRELSQAAESSLVMSAQLQMLSERINQTLSQIRRKSDNDQAAQ